MKNYGIDTAAPLNKEHLKNIKELGFSFVGRYLVPKTFWNALKPEEIKDIRDAGLAILLCWEIGGNDLKYPARAEAHALQAKQLAESYGIPEKTAIYFACDFNAQKEDFQYIDAYLRKAQDVFGDKYYVGLYGHNRVIDYIAQQGVINHFWQCVAWSNGVVSTYADAYQFQGQDWALAKDAGEKIGVAVDLNSCDDLFKAGLWLPPKPKEWYEDAMEWVKTNEIMMDGRPKDNVTRAEMAVMLQRFYNKFCK